MTFRRTMVCVAFCAAFGVASPVVAQEAETPRIGPETNQPLPRFVSLKASEANVRRGPSLSHRIDWVFQRRGMPLQVINEYGHWRRVIDRDGQGGWVHYSMLTGARTVIIEPERLFLRAQAHLEARETAELERDVVANLRQCAQDWCEVAVDGHRGWARKDVLWGVETAELSD